eukprot:7378251-Prymnesium_polylepis.1
MDALPRRARARRNPVVRGARAARPPARAVRATGPGRDARHGLRRRPLRLRVGVPGASPRRPPHAATCHMPHAAARHTSPHATRPTPHASLGMWRPTHARPRAFAGHQYHADPSRRRLLHGAAALPPLPVDSCPQWRGASGGLLLARRRRQPLRAVSSRSANAPHRALRHPPPPRRRRAIAARRRLPRRPFAWRVPSWHGSWHGVSHVRLSQSRFLFSLARADFSSGRAASPRRR